LIFELSAYAIIALSLLVKVKSKKKMQKNGIKILNQKIMPEKYKMLRK